MRSPAPLAASRRRSISRWAQRFQHWTEDLNIDGRPYRTIWLAADGWSVEIIDQTRLPHELAIVALRSVEDAARAIRTMQVRGAPLIGAAAAYGVCLALARGCLRRGAGPRRRPPRRAAADRRQPALGAGGDAQRRAQPAARGPRRGGLRARGGDLRGRREGQPPHRRARPEADPRRRPAQGAGRARQHPHPLQRRLARLRRRGHRDRRRSTRPTTAAFPSTCGSTRRARATRGRRSPPSSWAPTACRTPSSSTTPAGT